MLLLINLTPCTFLNPENRYQKNVTPRQNYYTPRTQDIFPTLLAQNIWEGPSNEAVIPLGPSAPIRPDYDYNDGTDYYPDDDYDLPQNYNMPQYSPATLIFFLILIVVCMLVLILISYTYYISQVYAGFNIYHGNLEPVKDVVKKSIKKLVNISILYFLQSLLIFIGFLLFIVPGVIWSIKYMFSFFILLDQNCGPVEAMKRSSKLTSGYKGTLFKKLLGLAGIQMLLLLPFFILAFISRSGNVGGFAIALYYSLITFVLVVFYFNLKEIKDTAVPVKDLATPENTNIVSPAPDIVATPPLA